MTISWVKVSELVLAGSITLIVSFATVLFHKWLTRRNDKKREGVLYEMAVLRGKGVELRNQGERSELTADELRNWLSKQKELETALIAKANEVSRVEGMRLECLDRVQPLAYPHIHNLQQITALQNLSGMLLRADLLLSKYRF